MLDARLYLRRAAASTDVVISDLTWSNSIAGELMFEYDLVIVPTSVSEIELAATVGFLNHHRWVFDSAIHTPPMLLLSPTRVLAEQMNSDIFSRQRFPVRFILPPPILEAQSAKNMFERGYLMDMPDACGQSFVEFGKAVMEAQTISACWIAPIHCPIVICCWRDTARTKPIKWERPLSRHPKPKNYNNPLLALW